MIILVDLTESVRRYTQSKMGGPYGQTMTMREVAARSGGGITENWLGRFLKGERNTLTVDQAEALAAGLGVTFEELLAGADAIRNPSPEQSPDARPEPDIEDPKASRARFEELSRGGKNRHKGDDNVWRLNGI